MSDKPLFIPLMGAFFDQFEDGSKDTEYRRLGPRHRADRGALDLGQRHA